MVTSSDSIKKNLLLHAPQERVWRAISDAKQFGHWFGVDFEGDFVAGAHMVGRLVPTKVDPEVAKSQKPYEGMAFEFHIDRIEPMRLFSFRWHPFAVDKDVDYSTEPMTLVKFELQTSLHGTLLTIVESGFAGLPLARRADAFSANEEGWTAQAQILEKYLTAATT